MEIPAGIMTLSKAEAVGRVRYLPLVILSWSFRTAAVLRGFTSAVHLIILLVFLVGDVLVEPIIVVLIICHFRLRKCATWAPM